MVFCNYSSQKSLLSQQNKFSESKVKFREASNSCKRVFGAVNLHMLLKQKSPSLPRNLALWTFGQLLIVFSTKVNLLYLFYSTDWRCYLLHLIKWNYLLKTFLRTLTSKIKKDITNLDSSKASGPDCIPVFPVSLNFLTYNTCLKKACFLNCWKVSLVVSVLRILGKGLRSTAKNY